MLCGLCFRLLVICFKLVILFFYFFFLFEHKVFEAVHFCSLDCGRGLVEKYHMRMLYLSYVDGFTSDSFCIQLIIAMSYEVIMRSMQACKLGFDVFLKPLRSQFSHKFAILIYRHSIQAPILHTSQLTHSTFYLLAHPSPQSPPKASYTPSHAAK